MSDIPGRSCLLTDVDDLFVAPPLGQTARRRTTSYTTVAEISDLQTRAASSAPVGHPAYICCDCGRSTTEDFLRRSRSGKVFCLVCAKRAVADFYRHHPEARPVPARIAAERTGVAYMHDRERYEVRYHAGNARWQISDTQTRRWCAYSSVLESEARETAAGFNARWRTQLATERLAFGSYDVPSTVPRHTARVGEARYGVDPA